MRSTGLAVGEAGSCAATAATTSAPRSAISIMIGRVNGDLLALYALICFVCFALLLWAGFEAVLK